MAKRLVPVSLLKSPSPTTILATSLAMILRLMLVRSIPIDLICNLFCMAMISVWLCANPIITLVGSYWTADHLIIAITLTTEYGLVRGNRPDFDS